MEQFRRGRLWQAMTLVRRPRPGDLVFGLVNPVVPYIHGDAFHVNDFDGRLCSPKVQCQF